MKRVTKKLHSRRGETLVEILVAILIIALSAGLFATMYMASMNINLAAQKQDERFYTAVEELEEMIDKGVGTGEKIDLSYQPEGGASSKEQVELFTNDGMSVYSEQIGENNYLNLIAPPNTIAISRLLTSFWIITLLWHYAMRQCAAWMCALLRRISQIRKSYLTLRALTIRTY